MSNKPKKDLDVESASMSSLTTREKVKQRWYIIITALGVVAGLLGFLIHIGLSYQPGINPPNHFPAMWSSLFSGYWAAFLTFYLWQGKFYSRTPGARIVKIVLWGFLAAAGLIVFICNLIIGEVAGGIWALLWCGWALGIFIGFIKTPTKHRPHRPKNNLGVKIVCGILRVIFYFFLALFTFLAALMLGHVTSLAAEQAALPVPGKLIEVDAGFPSGASMHMHMYCKGPTDSNFPTIVLPSGGGTCSASMMALQDGLAPNYRACVFDGAGYCWSDTGKVPYTQRSTTDQLAQMLDRSGEKGPFIMMGHSAGGQTSRSLRVIRPDLVAGIVLLDSVNIDWYRVYEAKTGVDFSANPNNTGLVGQVDVIRAFAGVGIQRLFQRPNEYSAKYQLAAGWTWWQTRNWNSQYWSLLGGDGDMPADWNENISGAYGDLPMLVLTASPLPGAPCSDYNLPDGPDCDRQRDINEAIFAAVVEGQRNLSSRGEYRGCPMPCNHSFAYTRVEWIIEQFESYFANITFTQN